MKDGKCWQIFARTFILLYYYSVTFLGSCFLLENKTQFLGFLGWINKRRFLILKFIFALHLQTNIKWSLDQAVKKYIPQLLTDQFMYQCNGGTYDEIIWKIQKNHANSYHKHTRMVRISRNFKKILIMFTHHEIAIILSISWFGMKLLMSFSRNLEP
jgi:hypothetical protein